MAKVHINLYDNKADSWKRDCIIPLAKKLADIDDRDHLTEEENAVRLKLHTIFVRIGIIELQEGESAHRGDPISEFWTVIDHITKSA